MLSAQKSFKHGREEKKLARVIVKGDHRTIVDSVSNYIIWGKRQEVQEECIQEKK